MQPIVESKITHLGSLEAPFLKLMSTKRRPKTLRETLPNLQSLVVRINEVNFSGVDENGEHVAGVLTRSVAALPGLERFTLISPMVPFDSVSHSIRSWPSTLRHFEFRLEVGPQYWGYTLTPETLRLLPTWFPNLISLALSGCRDDYTRNTFNSNLSDYASAIATLTQLEHLEIPFLFGVGASRPDTFSESDAPFGGQKTAYSVI